MEKDNFENINPYAAPTVDKLGSTGRSGRATFVPQIRIVAILMIVQGVLEMLFAGYLVVISFVLPWAASQQPQQNPMPAEEMQMLETVSVAMGVGGGFILVVAVLRLVAGILGCMYRGRTLGLVTHFLGLISLVSCYCLPTAVGLCVWGSIVYFNGEVAQAFKMRSEGYTIAEINEFFSR